MENTPTNTPQAAPPRRSSYLSINDFLSKSHTALSNARLANIAPLLEGRGIPSADVANKLIEVEALRALNEKQKKEYGEQYEATEAYNQHRDFVHEDYMDCIALARVAFKKDTAAKTALGLRGDRARSQSGYASQGMLFYNNALGSAPYKEILGNRGITENDLRAGQRAFAQLQTLTAAQQKETGEAQAATKVRDAAYDALQEWMSDFYSTAKVALRKNPQMMEQLGIKEV